MARMTRCKLLGSTFDACRFDSLVVEGGDWSFVGLPESDLRRASFSDARMRQADLAGAKAAGATLTGLDLSGASLHAIDLTGADLRGSDLSAIDLATAQLRGAIVSYQQAIGIAELLGLDVRAD
jgi:uncharacterized protein YjbI with pentapeptide repeats